MHRVHKVKEKDHLIAQAYADVHRLSRELIEAEDQNSHEALMAQFQEANRLLMEAKALPDNCLCSNKQCGVDFPQVDATVIVVARVIRGDRFIADDQDEKYVVLCPNCTSQLGLTDHLDAYEAERIPPPPPQE